MKKLLVLFLFLPSLTWGISLNNEIISNQLSNVLVQGLLLTVSLFFLFI